MRASLVLLGALAAGCGSSPSGEPPKPVASGSAAAAMLPPEAALSPDGEGRVEALRLAELRRLPSGVTAADQQSREPGVRRAAARALARIGGEASRPGLLRALGDEDDEVVAWAAYGLGFFCKGQEHATASALVARAVSRGSSASRPAALDASKVLDADSALARAIGRCAAEESEPTLVAWLQGPRSRALEAARGLGDVASVKQKLREETLAALLNAAAGSASSPPMAEALFPVGRLEHVPLTVVDRIREVAAARLADAGEARFFAVKALGRGGDAAAPDLAKVLGTPGSFTAAERAEAARGLKRLGKPGQRALAEALPALVPGADPVALTALVGEELGVLTSVLDALSEPGSAKKALTDLASLAPPPSAPTPVARRISALRCGAAKILAGADFHDRLLTGCEVGVAGAADAGTPSSGGGGFGARAMVEVLGRGELSGARLTALRPFLAAGADVRAREAALDLLETHDEVEAAPILVEALLAKEPGVVATAAAVIAKQPQRVLVEANGDRKKKHKRKKGVTVIELGPDAPPAPSGPLVKALLAALDRPGSAADPEIGTALIDALGAIALKEAKPKLDELCKSPYPTMREHAQKALFVITGDKKTCEAPIDGGPPPGELEHLARAKATLSLDSDAGALTLTLDPTLAPVFVTRVLDLAGSGFYDGMVVHRVVPGFVVQFGAPFADGIGGPEGKPALRCETSPIPFAPLSVGVALDGRDTGSSQIFVTLARHPHLDGLYAEIGTASGPWSSLAEGDVIHRVKIGP